MLCWWDRGSNTNYSDIFDTTYSFSDLAIGQTYFWKVLAKNITDDSLWSSDTFRFEISPTAGLEENNTRQGLRFELYGNYPNYSTRLPKLFITSVLKRPEAVRN